MVYLTHVNNKKALIQEPTLIPIICLIFPINKPFRPNLIKPTKLKFLEQTGHFNLLI